MECKPSIRREEPWLLYEQQGQNYMFSPFAPRKSGFRVGSTPHLSGKIILASYYGWFVVANSEDRACLCLYHPFSRDTIELPRLEIFSKEIDHWDGAVQVFILTCPPDDDNIDTGSCVLMISHKGLLMYCRVGFDDNWHMHRFETEVEGVMKRIIFKGLAIYKGNIHGLVIDDEVILLRIQVINRGLNSKSSVTIKSVARFSLTKVSNHQSPCIVPTLVTVGDDLCCVLVYTGLGEHINVQDVQVKKFVSQAKDNDDDDDNLTIVELESLENHAIFAGLQCSFACDIALPHRECASFGLPESLFIQKNCVYFLSFDTRAIYVYRLQDRNLVAVNLSPNVKISWDRLLWVKSVTKKRYLDHSEIKTSVGNVEMQGKKGARLSELPTELLTLVARRLTLLDYSNFRATCKEFRDAAPPLSSWLDMRAKIEFMEITKSSIVLPWLLYTTNDDKLCNIIDPVHTNDRYLMTIPRSQSFDAMAVFHSKDGLLLMYGESGNMFFYNPFTKVKTDTKCPTNRDPSHIRCVGCSSVPNSQDECIIVGLHCSKERLLVSSYVYGQEESWRNVQATGGVGDTPFIAGDNSPVYYKKSFYFLDVTGRLAKFKMMPNGERKCKIMKRPTKPACIDSSAHMTTYLLECHGELLAIGLCRLHEWMDQSISTGFYKEALGSSR